MGIILVMHKDKRFMFLLLFFDFLLTPCQEPGATKVCSLEWNIPIAGPSLSSNPHELG